MRLAIACGSFAVLGGRERDCLALSAELARLGHSVTLLTAHPPPAAVEADLPVEGAVSLPVRGFSNHVRARRFARAVLAWRRANAVDALIGFDRMPDLDFFYAADLPRPRHRGLKALLPRNRTYRTLEAAVFGAGSRTRIFFLAERQAAAYAALYPLPPHRHTVLPLTLKGDRRPPGTFYATRGAVRDELGIPADAALIVNVAAYGRQKGVDRIIESLPGLPDAHLLSVGMHAPGPFRKQAQQLGVAARVHFVPYADAVDRLIGAADVMAHPARVENTGNVIIESLLYGVPVVASGNCGYATEIARSGAGVVLAEPYEQGALLAALRAALAPERLAELRRLARAHSPVIAASPGMAGIAKIVSDSVEEAVRARP